MEITIIAEASGEGLHPVTEQLVGAASSLGGVITVLCPGGVGSNDASVISGHSRSEEFQRSFHYKETASHHSIADLGRPSWLRSHREWSWLPLLPLVES